jgi:hypothetical protein
VSSVDTNAWTSLARVCLQRSRNQQIERAGKQIHRLIWARCEQDPAAPTHTYATNVAGRTFRGRVDKARYSCVQIHRGM